MNVRVIKEYHGLWEGSVIQDCEEKENTYKGVHSSVYGTYVIEVPKNHCEEIIPVDELRDKKINKILN